MKSLLAFLLMLAFLFLASLGGCAHSVPTGCVEPEVRAAREGVLLECREQREIHPGTGKRDKIACTVSTSDGDKTFYYKECR